MEFKSQKPIYRQIADFILEMVLSEQWKGGDRIQSVRELAAEVEVNPNTVARTFNFLNDRELIYNKRGVGYFLVEDALEKAYSLKKDTFVKEELPDLFKTMDLLKIDFNELKNLYQDNHHENK